MDGIGWAAAAMTAARERLETAAANLANSATEGFRAVRLRGRLRAGAIAFERVQDGGPPPLRRTGRALDLAAAGGTIALRDRAGNLVRSRGGSFVRDVSGHLQDAAGNIVLGPKGPVSFPQGALVRPDGAIVHGGVVLDRIALAPGVTLRSGFVPAPAVDAIGEMVDLLAAQRSFETAQRALEAIDQTRERSASQVALVRG